MARARPARPSARPAGGAAAAAGCAAGPPPAARRRRRAGADGDPRAAVPGPAGRRPRGVGGCRAPERSDYACPDVDHHGRARVQRTGRLQPELPAPPGGIPAVRAPAGARPRTRSRLRHRAFLPGAGPARDGRRRRACRGARGSGARDARLRHALAAVRRRVVSVGDLDPLDRARARSRARDGRGRAGARTRRARDLRHAQPADVRPAGRDHRPLPPRRVRPRRAARPVRALLRLGRGDGRRGLGALPRDPRRRAARAGPAAGPGPDAAAPLDPPSCPSAALRPAAAQRSGHTAPGRAGDLTGGLLAVDRTPRAGDRSDRDLRPG